LLSFRSAVLTATRKLDDAEKLLNTDQPELLLQLANIQALRNDFEAAARTLAKYPGFKSYDYYSTISLVSRGQGKIEEAQKNIDLALKLNPRSAEAHRQQGLIHFQGGDYARAEASLRKALQLQPNRLEVMVELGEPLIKLGKTEEAKRLGAAVLIQSAAPELRERAKKLVAE
jgi:tetratricopeptide (TPR) repeat protein